MKALTIPAPRQVEVSEVSKPEPRDGEVLLRVRRVGFCGSDLTTYLGKNPMVDYPRIPGHEIAATIESVTREVPEFLAPGMDVTVMPYTSCGACPSCRRGRFNACRSNKTLGVQRDGALAEYLALPWQKIVPADGLSLTELALVEPLTVGFHAVDRARVDDTSTVMVLGCGMIGLGAVARAVHRGADVIAVDIDDAKLGVAKGFGANHAVNSKTSDLHASIQALTDGDGPDVVVEAAGNPVTYRAAFEEAAFSGRVVCIGYAKEDVSLATRLFVQKELDVHGSRNATPTDFQAASAYLGRGGFPVESVVSRTVGIGDAPDALRDWAEDPPTVTKILVNMDG